MADLDLTEKLGGQPKYVWILGGVAVLTGFIYFRNKKNVGTVSTPTDVASLDSGLQTGTSGGSGLASYDSYATPGGTGITSPTPVPTNPTPTLSQGQTGEAVTMLQRELNSLGFNVTATGIFDYNTRKAVMAYQTSRGLSVDGTAGSQTWSAIIHGTAPITTHKPKPAVAKVANPHPTPVKKAAPKAKAKPKKRTRQA